MYIKNLNANIKIVLTIVVLSYILLIFPIFIRIDTAFNKDVKKILYKVRLFNTIVIFFGYIEKIDEGIAVHLTKRKAIIITNDKIFDVKNKIKPLKDYHIIKFYAKIDLGSEENILKPLSVAFMINFATEYFDWFLKNSKQYVKFNSEINVHEEQDVFCVKLNATFVFNLLMVTISLIKIILEKTFYAIKYRKQQN